MTLWDDVFHAVAAAYPSVPTESWLVDAVAARFALRPETLDVVVASNLFADILSDRRYPSMFERVMRAIDATTASGHVTPDLGGTCSTREVAEAVMAALAGQGVSRITGAA